MAGRRVKCGELELDVIQWEGDNLHEICDFVFMRRPEVTVSALTGSRLEVDQNGPYVKLPVGCYLAHGRRGKFFRLDSIEGYEEVWRYESKEETDYD